MTRQLTTRSPTHPRKARGTALPSGISGLTLALLLSTTTQAQILSTGTPAADILLTQALAEQQVFLTCTALDPPNHQIALDYWQGEVAAVATLLAERGVALDAVQAFATAADPATLMLAPDTPFAEVQEFCAAQDAWFMRWMRRDFTSLTDELPGVLP